MANKAKALILRWSKSLGRKHPIFSSLEKQLRARGVDFGDGPVKTKVDQSNKTKISPRPQIIEPSSPDSSAEKFEPEYVDKIRGNLRTVVDYIFMARDMLASVENYSIDDTLVSIISCIEEMHRRLTILVIEIEDSEFVAVFIRLIDLIQETLGWYQALKKRQKDAVKLMQVNKEKLELAIQNLGTGVPVILDNESHLEENHAKSSEEKGTEDFLGLNFMSNTSENSSKGKKDAVEDLFQFQLKLASENSANAEKSKSESKESVTIQNSHQRFRSSIFDV